MGDKTIWDGQGCPQEGREVLIHLASAGWVKHIATGHTVTPHPRHGKDAWLVSVQLGPSKDSRSSNNERHLGDCYPVDTPLDQLPKDGIRR